MENIIYQVLDNGINNFNAEIILMTSGCLHRDPEDSGIGWHTMQAKDLAISFSPFFSLAQPRQKQTSCRDNKTDKSFMIRFF